MSDNRAAAGAAEFVALMALLISLTAMSIDAILPALTEIGAALGVVNENNNQLLVTALFIGFSFGQIFYGPLSDSIGRKNAIYLGLFIFMTGCLLSLFAADFEQMLTGRFLQGLGAAGPRIVTVAMVRDRHEGRAMARIMSFVMAVFILVPALAPALGQAVMLLAGWRAIFVMFLLLAVTASLWLLLRQPETLPRERRRRLSSRVLLSGIAECFRNRSVLGHILATGTVSGAFIAYLSSAQQIFQVQYALGEAFPIYFGALALAIGAASIANGRLVMRFGMQRLSSLALVVLIALSFGFLPLALLADGHPPLWQFVLFLMGIFFCIGMLFGNLNALAMEPLGHIAGIGAAVVGSVSTLISVLLAIVIGLLYDGTIVPLVTAFALLGVVSLAFARWAASARQTSA
ncbi:multidrug effflux MFS transporter [Oceanibacterium hippocampi]|uniref:Bcr/CflA family efflux transporter n=1 Tax=Oceanibacterium hippocampi TaxID=745714 RepID=A0A1Y5TBJ1_9PROT|nr:multidrug effflux MFS transporter [Oceanibacterium hippocampi]SLN60317.1 Bicyclomycin resistance protein [Oceanibacterium hippocampi]